ncbi:Rho GTPase activation protein [Lichtheimia hyalospora FSU 10163]|nr:Rho GTPase activation protein [Lichtheimia hyalospora FSU 10163]
MTSKVERKSSLGSWLKRATSGRSKRVFGISLCKSIRYAKVSVGYVDETSVKHPEAGTIPIVVAQCGSFLKAKGLLEPYVFLLPGDKRHVDTLQSIFDDPRQSHGLYLDWDSGKYSVHDAASILERYLDQLPEPVIPREHSSSFCALMVQHDKQAIADHFRQLVQKLPIPHQHLLLYLVDLLSLFASNSDSNSMDSSKLTDIFTSRIIGSCGVNQHQAQSFIHFMIGSQALFMKQLYGSQKETNRHLDHSASNNQLSSLSTTLPLMAPKPVRPIPINLITRESITFVPPTLYAKRQSQKRAVQSSSDSSNHRHTIATASCQAATVSSLSTFQRARVLMDAKIKVLIRSWQDKPIGYLIWTASIALIIAVLMYEIYQAIWGTCCFEPYIFFAGFIFYWIMLIRGIQWHDGGQDSRNNDKSSMDRRKGRRRNEMPSSQVRKGLRITKQYMRVLT